MTPLTDDFTKCIYSNISLQGFIRLQPLKTKIHRKKMSQRTFTFLNRPCQSLHTVPTDFTPLALTPAS